MSNRLLRPPMILRAHAVFLACAFATGAIAAEPTRTFDPAEGRCQSADDKETERRLMGTLAYIEQVLPNIPPEEDRYLQVESDAALKVYAEERDRNDGKALAGGQGQRRFAALLQRPLYEAWSLRRDVVKLRTEFENMVHPAKDWNPFPFGKVPEADKLNRAVHSVPALGNFNLALGGFLAKQLASPHPLITSDQYDGLHGRALMLQLDLKFYMGCKLAKIVGPQPWR